MDSRPVGIFDSGMGGISLLRDAVRLLPHENFIYYGDNANAPYGDRSEKEILQLTSNAADFLLDHGVKALVIACNTATSASINILRQKLDVPVISMEPAIKPACEMPGDGKVFHARDRSYHAYCKISCSSQPYARPRARHQHRMQRSCQQD